MAQIADMIQYEGDNNTFIWKHPREDFHSLTQLLVHESQEAIFFMNGQALDLFGPGRYTLETQNIPKIGKLLNRLTGDRTPFHCEVYFINQTVQMSLKWGTDSKVRYLEPEYGVPLELGASGEMNLQVSDSRKLLVKLVGTMNGIAWEERGDNFTKSLQASFRPLISTAVKSHLTAAIKSRGINIFEVDEHLEELSAALRDSIMPGFEEYGLTIPQFYLTTVVLPDNDPNFKRIRELYTVSLQTKTLQAEAQVKAAQAQAAAQAGTAQAQAEAEIIAARRLAEMERQETETQIAKQQAERKVIEAKAEAEAQRTTGYAEADVMARKGYSERDVLQSEVQKAFAQGIGNMGGGSGGGVASDLIGIIAGMKAAGMAVDNMGGALGSAQTPQVAPVPPRPAGEAEACPHCGATISGGAKFCIECGMKIERAAPNETICASCGKKTPKGKFCIECGAPLANKCSKCGAELPAGAKFCFECGEKL